MIRGCRSSSVYLFVVATLGGFASIHAADHAGSARTDSLAIAAESFYNAGKYQAARRAYEERIELLRLQFGSDQQDIVESMIGLSATYWKLGQHVLGEKVAREAIDLARDRHGDGHPQIGEGLNVLGLCCMAQGKFNAAEQAYDAALALFREQLGDECEEVSMCLNNLGALAGEQSKWVRADALYRASLRLNRDLFGDDDLRVARSMHNIGYAAIPHGNMLEARHFLERALEIRRQHLGDDHPDVALTLQTLARTYRRDDPEHACELFEQVLELRRRTLGNRHPHVAWALRDLGRQCTAVCGDYDLAEAQLREALAIYEDSNEPLEHARTLREMATLKGSQGQFAEAESLVVQACEMGLGTVGRSRSTTLQFFATLRCMEERYAEAESHLEAAVDAFEETRVPYVDARGRLYMSFESPYPLLAATYLRCGKTEDAWPAVERSRARGLIDNLAGERENQAAPVRSLAEVQSVLNPDEAIVGWLDTSYFQSPAGTWAYVIREEGPVYWSREDVMSQRQEVYGVPTLTGGRAVSFRESLRYAAAWPARVTDVARVTRDAHALWRERFAPIDVRLRGVRHLIVISSEAMDGIPIEALVDDNGRVMDERFDVTYAPSATVYLWVAAQKSDKDEAIGSALLVGDPPFDRGQRDAPPQVTMGTTLDVTVMRGVLAGDPKALASLPRLPQSSDEVKAIASNLFEPTVLLGRDASEEAITRLLRSGEMGRYDALHFATHAIIDDAFPELSALVLSQTDLPDALTVETEDDLFDGLITVEDIFGKWHLGAELVTLSGCRTGLGRRIRGEGYLGFAQAFMRAGARSVILSLWDVDDTATSMLMARFYQNLCGHHSCAPNNGPGEKFSKAAALREAKQWLRNYEENGFHPYAHPAYWAAFVLIGDG